MHNPDTTKTAKSSRASKPVDKSTPSYKGNSRTRVALEPALDVSFREFQQLIYDRYYASDAARGVPGTFMWLIEEVGELATALQDNAPGKSPTAAEKANLQEEFADVLAWLTTIANIAGVDLASTLTKYTDKDRVKGVKS